MTSEITKNILVDEFGDTQYTHIHPSIHIYTIQSNDEGVTWCENCFDDKSPVLVVSVNEVEAMTLCQKCIGLMFSMRKGDSNK